MTATVAASPRTGGGIRSASVGPIGAPLDGLRGLGMVVLVASRFAVPELSGGWIGLEVLFVAAGYAVTAELLGAADDGRRRRDVVARQAVPYGAALTVLLAFATAWAYVQDGGLTGPVRRAVFLGAAQLYNVGSAFGDVDHRAFGDLWSLGVQWQFALLVAGGAGALLGFQRRHAGALLVMAAGQIAVLRALWLGMGGSESAIYVLTWFRLDGLLLGAAVAIAGRALTDNEREWLHPFAAVGTLALVLLTVSLPRAGAGTTPGLAAAVPLASAAAALVVLALVADAGPAWLARVLSVRPLRWIGAAWLSAYLWFEVVGVRLVGGGAETWQGWGLAARQFGFTALAATACHQLVVVPAARWAERRTAG